MELHKVKELLAKYEEGNTSLTEEKMLRSYFLSDHIAPEVSSYQPLFSFYDREGTQRYEAKITVNRSSYVKWIGIAASIIVILSLFLLNEFGTTNDLGTYEDPEIALKKTKEVLHLVGSFMNEGTEQLGYIKEIEHTGNQILK
ncbi:hypothetical protein GCM10009117_10790 [Gangjinia marincola]|uniref:Uncharacterized protein n=1 Tax=Gangjinia marincola TaxID=578463 RepID=A0ABP3XRC9_9FLAO